MRILTTHVGSLPRPDDLVALLRQHDAAGSAPEALAARARSAVDDAVRAQVAAGIDIVNDGEQGRTDYSTYIKDRLTGFEGEHADQVTGADLKEFPEFAARRRASVFRRPTCTGPIAWKDFGAVERDIRGLAESARRAGADNVFMTAVSPGQAARFLLNRHYPTDEAYVGALADVLKREYAAIVGAGLVLQLNCPDLASGRNNQFQHLTLRQFQKVAAMHVEALNHAVAGLPPERMRLHICWGNYEGPHHRDVPLRDILPILLGARPAGLSVEAANPRHAHEWSVFEEVRLPAGKVVIPGVLDTTTNFIEHPELIAQRIVQYARLVGREKVIASADCGFATFADTPTVDPKIAWAKLGAMVEGARLASRALWKRSRRVKRSAATGARARAARRPSPPSRASR
jgi:5-methyltetrahydropteroyltriglutamate--homocysteine methyltransferase